VDNTEEKRTLTEKQELFCQRYLIDFNATKAAKEAGYSEDTASAIGWENLRKPDIQARISELRAQMGNQFNVTRERIAQELALIAFGDTKILFDEHGNLKSPDDWNEEGRVIASYEESVTEFGDENTGGTKTTKKVKQWDKIKAIEALNRLMGYNAPEKFDHTTLGKEIQGFNYLPPQPYQPGYEQK
jgi:phage terminase small subunit